MLTRPHGSGGTTMKLRALTCVGSLLGMLLVGLATTAVTAPAAQAATSCSADKAGKTRKVYSNVTRGYILTEALLVEVARGTEFHDNITWTVGATRTNSVKMSSEISTSVKAGIFGGAEVKVGGEFGTASTKSVHVAQSQTWDITKPGKYFIARGFQKFAVNVAMQRCKRMHFDSDHYVWSTYNSGTVRGYGKAVGTVRCADSYPRGSFRRFVKVRRC
jgi:hypothetical protein